jgi:hypothetical protein
MLEWNNLNHLKTYYKIIKVKSFLKLYNNLTNSRHFPLIYMYWYLLKDYGIDCNFRILYHLRLRNCW